MEKPYLSLRDKTWLQLPGAAQRSTAFVTPENKQSSKFGLMWNFLDFCVSLKIRVFAFVDFYFSLTF